MVPMTPSKLSSTLSGLVAAAGLVVSGNASPLPIDDTADRIMPITRANPLNLYNRALVTWASSSSRLSRRMQRITPVKR